MPSVHALWHYPVKSLGGCSADTLAFDARGAVGDRGWAVITAAGKIGSGKNTRRFERVEGLLKLASGNAPDGTPTILLPDGRALPVDADATASALSEVLGRPVTLAPERNVRHFDDDGVHLLSLASVDWVSDGVGEASVDARRFRANILIGGTADGLPEDAWVGRELVLGSVRLRVNSRAERCVMVNSEQRELPSNQAILRHLGRHNDACLGVYASVVTPGSVHVGDELRVV